MIHCPEIFNGLFLHPSGKDQINYSPCCQAHTKTTGVENFNFKTDENLLRLRSENISGLKSSECERCWTAEENNHTSKRQSSINYCKQNNISKSESILFLEYNSTWSCNLKCIMCSPEYSSSLAKESGAIDVELKESNINRKLNNIIDRLDLSEARRIHFNGGEPLINNNHKEVIEKVKDKSNLSISYNTNGTKRVNQEILNLWSQCKYVRIFFSIDAIGTAFDYIRYGALWSEVKENLEWYKNNVPSNVMFGLNVTVGSYNILEIPELFNWYKNNFSSNRDGDITEFNWQFAYNYPMGAITQNVKEVALDELKVYAELEPLYNSLLECKTTDKLSFTMLDKIDIRRNTSWRNSLRIGNYETN